MSVWFAMKVRIGGSKTITAYLSVACSVTIWMTVEVLRNNSDVVVPSRHKDLWSVQFESTHLFHQL